MDRSAALHQTFRWRLSDGDLPEGPAPQDVPDASVAWQIYRAQCQSRHLDLAARQMQRQGQGFYTIGSSGHEGMAAVAAALRPADMAFLHYRDGAFQCARAAQVEDIDPIRDILLSLAASSEDPISGGRHKVLGSRALMIPPQTSTIASHLPKAVGAAYSISLAKRLGADQKVLADDGVIMASFGDASTNHSTAQGAINSALWARHLGAAMPLLLVCEDNGIGISTPTPRNWIARNFENRPGLAYFAASGLDLFNTLAVAREAVDFVRSKRRPAFLHMTCVRLMGHAGSDVERAYLTKETIESWEAQDPLLQSARLMVDAGLASAQELLDEYDACGKACLQVMKSIRETPRLETADAVARSIVPPKREGAPLSPPHTEPGDAQPMNVLINRALGDLMETHRNAVIMGEDVGRKGGVYGITKKLITRFGAHRVIDTLLDEQSILGLAIGMAHNGVLPVPEIQFLAYLHNAEDQLRGEAATLSFFSNGQFTNPMVVRIAGLGYQRGFGGHFHNDNSLAVLRDIPGLIVVCPSNGADAVTLLRRCFELARIEQRVVVFLEPIALYGERDLHEAEDGGWMRTYPAADEIAEFGAVAVEGEGTDLAIVSYGNGYRLSSQAAHLLQDIHQIKTRLIDLRWLAPLPEESLLEALGGVDRVLIVDECRKSGNVSEALMTLLAENGLGPVARVTASDCFIATGPAYAATLPSRDGIVEAAIRLVSTPVR